MYSYHFEGKLLIIREIKTDVIKWQGQFYGCSIRKVLPSETLSGCVLLLDYYEFSQSEFRSAGNLFFINSTGTIIWHADLPSTSDVYLDFDEIVDQKISAYSWNGYFVNIDLHTGRIISQLFTK